MSNRVFRTEKVDDIIGLGNIKKYDKIDIFSEQINPNNVFGLAEYTEYVKGKKVVKQEVIPLGSLEAMIRFLKENFDTYELNHYVRDDQKHIFFHYVDYCNVNYYLHDGKPNKNYIVLSYREYANGTFYPKSMPFPKEYEKFFVDIVNRSKPQENNNKPVFAKDIDVNEKRKKNFQDNIQKYTIPMGELLKITGQKLHHLKDNKRVISGLKIIIGSAALAAILAGGYVLVDKFLANSDYLEQENPIRNVKDIGIFIDKANMGEIIEKLMLNKYEEVTFDNLKSVIEFLNRVDSSNYDKNDSFNSFDYDDYFDYLLLGTDYYSESREILEEIERYYKSSFENKGNKKVVNMDEAKKYIEYVAPLTFMYDTYHSDRPFSTVTFDSQSLYSPYVRSGEIKVFDSYPPILRYIILNQLKGLLLHTNYELSVEDRPSYYFDGRDKYTLLDNVKEKLNSIEEELYDNCAINYKGSK